MYPIATPTCFCVSPSTFLWYLILNDYLIQIEKLLEQMDKLTTEAHKDSE